MRRTLLERAMRRGVLALVAVLAALSTSGGMSFAAGEVFTVNSPADTNDGACTLDAGGCTLREAIEAANANGNPYDQDTIAFAIPGAGVHTIAIGTGNPPTADLPPILQPLLIDGTTQPGAGCSARHLLIELDGTGISGAGIGLNLAGAASVIRGISIYGASIGIMVQGEGGHIIECSHLGVDASGTAVRGEGRAAYVTSDDNLIGGDTAEAANIIGGFEGISIEGTTSNRIAGNSFGVFLSRDALLEGQVRSGVGLRYYNGPASLSFYDNSVAGWDIGLMGEGSGHTPIQNSTFGLPGESAGDGWNRVGVLLLDTPNGLILSSNFLGNEIGISSVDSLVQLIWSEVWNSSDCGFSVAGDGGGHSNSTLFEGNARAMCAQGENLQLSASGSTFRNGLIGVDYNGSGAGRSIGIGGSTFVGLDTAIQLRNPGGVSIDQSRFGAELDGTPNANGHDIVIDSTSVSPEQGIRVDDNMFSGTGGTSIESTGPVHLSISYNSFELSRQEPYVSAPSAGLRIEGPRGFFMFGNLVQNAQGPGMVLDYLGQESRAEMFGNKFIRSMGPGIELSTGDVPAWLKFTSTIDNQGPGIVLHRGTAHFDTSVASGNQGIPLDLGGDGPSLNDPGDGDSGPNHLLNYPTVGVQHLTNQGVHVEVDGQVPPDAIAASLLIRVGIGCSGYQYGSERLTFEVPLTKGQPQFHTERYLPGARLGDGVATALSYADAAGTWRTSEYSPCAPVRESSSLTITSIEPPSVKAGSGGIEATISYREGSSSVRAYANGLELEVLEGPTGNPGMMSVFVPASMLTGPGKLDFFLDDAEGMRSNTYTVSVDVASRSDVNANGSVDGTDVLCALWWLIGDYRCFGNLPDVNLDNDANLADAVYIRRVVAGLLPE